MTLGTLKGVDMCLGLMEVVVWDGKNLNGFNRNNKFRIQGIYDNSAMILFDTNAYHTGQISFSSDICCLFQSSQFHCKRYTQFFFHTGKEYVR